MMLISQEQARSSLGLGKALFVKYSVDPVNVKFEHIVRYPPLDPPRPEITERLFSGD